MQQQNLPLQCHTSENQINREKVASKRQGDHGEREADELRNHRSFGR
jgi:hypothetical protein